MGDKNAIKKFKKEIKEYFVTKEEGEVNEYVGCMIKKVNGGIYLHQTDLIKKIKEKFEEELSNVQGYRTPATPGQGTIRTKEGDKCLNKSKQFKYRSAVEMMSFLVKNSRLDIANTVQELPKVNYKANYAQYKQMLREVKYLLHTRNRISKSIPEKKREK